MIDRHLRTHAPLSRAGLLIVPADDRLLAVDAYNGTPQWDLAVPGLTRTGMPYDGGYLALGERVVFVLGDVVYETVPAP